MVGDRTHTFWDYPKIQTFWKNIKGEMERILKLDIPLDPLLFLLDVLPHYQFTTNVFPHCMMNLHLLVQVCLAILLCNVN